MAARRFELTEEHIQLLRHANIRFDDEMEWGGPAFDFKRPFGNGDLFRDMDRILGGHPGTSGEELPPNRRRRYEQLYRELATALELVLRTYLHRGLFVPGVYEEAERGVWRRVE